MFYLSEVSLEFFFPLRILFSSILQASLIFFSSFSPSSMYSIFHIFLFPGFAFFYLFYLLLLLSRTFSSSGSFIYIFSHLFVFLENTLFLWHAILCREQKEVTRFSLLLRDEEERKEGWAKMNNKGRVGNMNRVFVRVPECSARHSIRNLEKRMFSLRLPHFQYLDCFVLFFLYLFWRFAT